MDGSTWPTALEIDGPYIESWDNDPGPLKSEALSENNLFCFCLQLKMPMITKGDHSYMYLKMLESTSSQISLQRNVLFPRNLYTHGQVTLREWQLSDGSPNLLIYYSPAAWIVKLKYAWVKVFRINPEFRTLRLTFQRKSASEC